MGEIKHTDLIEALEAAEVGSRELDARLWMALVECDRMWRYWAPVDENHGHGEPSPGALYYAPHCAQVFVTPEVTTSLDAALALAERVLGNGPCNLHRNGPAEWGFTYVDCDTAYAATPALALCAAILRAREGGQ